MLACALAGLLVTVAQESLLPPAPAGWRAERLELPLSFAPELDYRGVEDLLFAPGMFAPGSDSYFSYALALRITGPTGEAVELGKEELQRFLETYYRGLCRAVAEDRGLERDAGTVRAQVRREGALFRATVAMFDPFTSGDPLELALELQVHPLPRATEVLGLASPLDADAPVWKELRALGAAWREARPAPVFLNHLYAVVDPETYAALAGSRLLREGFAISEERTTVRADLVYSGLYFYGQHTYFEFLQPDAAIGTGLALGVEHEGALQALARRLEAEGVRSQAAPITRKLEAEPLPWFDLLGMELAPSALTLFAMEYDPSFLQRWHAGKAPLAGGITRADVLERYADVLGLAPLRPEVLFQDVTAIELELSDAARDGLLAVARAARFEVEARGEARICLGPGVRLELRPPVDPSAPRGITRFELALRRPLEHEPLRLGRVTLSFHGRSATLDLGR